MGERELFEILVREHAPMLTAYIRSMTLDSDLAEEVFQETVIAAWRHLEDFDRTRPFGPWLRGLARHRLLMLARTRRRYGRHLEALERRISAGLERIRQRPGDTFAEQLEPLRECLRALPEPQRAALEMVYLRQVGSPAAAEALGTNLETLRKRVQRARQALALCLRSRGVLGGDEPEGTEALA
ncbi:MAG: sigma-70 family RNA polymerase sigma factor [Phycisphaerales bacterium]|nr:sigma-70 family RNA polymerase sigma factor [Phycisphaerales bacterium]